MGSICRGPSRGICNAKDDNVLLWFTKNLINQAPGTIKTIQELIAEFDSPEQYHWAQLDKYYAETDAERCALDLKQGIRLEEYAEIAKNMLAIGLSSEQIAAYTGLTINQIKKIKNT